MVLSSCCREEGAALPLTLILSFCRSNEYLQTSLGAGQCAVLQSPVNRTHRMLSFLTKLLRQTRKDYPRGACGGLEARGPSWSRGIFGGSLEPLWLLGLGPQRREYREGGLLRWLGRMRWQWWIGCVECGELGDCQASGLIAG